MENEDADVERKIRLRVAFEKRSRAFKAADLAGLALVKRLNAAVNGMSGRTDGRPTDKLRLTFTPGNANAWLDGVPTRDDLEQTMTEWRNCRMAMREAHAALDPEDKAEARLPESGM